MNKRDGETRGEEGEKESKSELVFQVRRNVTSSLTSSFTSTGTRDYELALPEIAHYEISRAIVRSSSSIW